jgi:plasmid stability protein
MTNQSVTISLPESIYQRIKERAERAQRSIEDEIAEVVVSAVPAEDNLPPELAQVALALDFMSDKALWKSARSRVSVRDMTKIERLHFKRQSAGLTESEQRTLKTLMQEYERSVLVRAKATALLHRRGYDVSVLVKDEA